MRVLVVGAGAIGSVLGGLLAKSGHEVTLLGRPWHLDVVRRQGLAVTGLWGEHLIKEVRTATGVDELGQGSAFDWIFVCVKTYQTAAVAEWLPRLLGPQTAVCLFQNGLGNYEAMCKTVAPDRVALGRVIFGAEIEPGRVRVTVCADAILIGSPDARFPKPRIEELVAALQQGGVPARTTDAILSAIWAKVLYNCALNGLSTLFEVPYGKILERELARGLMRSIIEETYAVAAAHEITLDPSTADAYRELLFTRLIPVTAAHRSSMFQDVLRGKSTEIEALNGAIVRLGRQKGIATPANALVTRLVHAKEQFMSVSGAFSEA